VRFSNLGEENYFATDLLQSTHDVRCPSSDDDSRCCRLFFLCLEPLTRTRQGRVLDHDEDASFTGFKALVRQE
jgi:hypothetical protein